MKDLEFLSGQFFDTDIPKEKAYLLKYFTSDLQRSFLKYFFVFDSWKNFIDHTGLYCSERLLDRFQQRYHNLCQTYDEAKKSLTEEGMAMVHVIESGNFHLTGEQDLSTILD